MYFKHDGSLAIGQVRADHGYLKYFDKNGIQVKGKTVVEDGKTYYYDANSGALCQQAALLRLHQTNGLTSILMAKPLKASGLSMARNTTLTKMASNTRAKPLRSESLQVL